MRTVPVMNEAASESRNAAAAATSSGLPQRPIGVWARMAAAAKAAWLEEELHIWSEPHPEVRLKSMEEWAYLFVAESWDHVPDFRLASEDLLPYFF